MPSSNTVGHFIILPQFVHIPIVIYKHYIYSVTYSHAHVPSYLRTSGGQGPCLSQSVLINLRFLAHNRYPTN